MGLQGTLLNADPHTHLSFNLDFFNLRIKFRVGIELDRIGNISEGIVADRLSNNSPIVGHPKIQYTSLMVGKGTKRLHGFFKQRGGTLKFQIIGFTAD
ncbi:hypothetical protein PROH_14530 [Prochlorothrix hollandica PCC 9006 = CALU 1027]|uniref:Uncharacterized protein n=1 Tax=Prochlorothrix hollandica PCC 9006 = CALU 1027 TaxID=317619 RepID=A0A0M2PR76_PROHO|nr:hypothetical protein PROH_14530 [Prochlorothrix hollandica PCC 9006 = CALU 1027]